jgi:imidazoleglycerol-phosphate dehydratase
MERKGTVSRKTAETEVTAEVILDSVRDSAIESGVPFFDHMLASMAKHGRFFLKLSCAGDREIDDHHSVEDSGIVIGQALKQALGDKAGIRRFGSATIPMDDALTLAAVDLSGRPFFEYSGPGLNGVVGSYSEELTEEFMRALAMNAGINLHVKVFYGQNRHHVHETIFKALGMALRDAVSIDEILRGGVPSIKGTI